MNIHEKPYESSDDIFPPFRILLWINSFNDSPISDQDAFTNNLLAAFTDLHTILLSRPEKEWASGTFYGVKKRISQVDTQDSQFDFIL